MFRGAFGQWCVYIILLIFVAGDGGDHNGVCGGGDGEHINK